MKLSDINTKVNEAFDSKKFDKSVDKAIIDLWKAYNDLEASGNLLKGSDKMAWKKKISIIEKAINNVDGQT